MPKHLDHVSFQKHKGHIFFPETTWLGSSKGRRQEVISLMSPGAILGHSDNPSFILICILVKLESGQGRSHALFSILNKSGRAWVCVYVGRMCAHECWCMWAYVDRCAHECHCPQRPEWGVQSSGARITIGVTCLAKSAGSKAYIRAVCSLFF